MSKEKKNEAKGEKITVLTSSDETPEVSRLMNTYSDMANPWVLSTIHAPMFPYWRDIRIRLPLVDLADYGDRFSVTAELPGFDKEDIEVTVNGYSVEIKAEWDLEETGKTKNYVQRERLHSLFHRVVQFPQEVTPSKAKAFLKNGLLEIEVPKIQPTSEKSRRIAIKS